jgi:hypothetical protein
MLDEAARAAYAAFCASDPLQPREPDWGREGYKVEAAVWQAVARAVLGWVNWGEREQARLIAALVQSAGGKIVLSYSDLQEITGLELVKLHRVEIDAIEFRTRPLDTTRTNMAEGREF